MSRQAVIGCGICVLLFASGCKQLPEPKRSNVAVPSKVTKPDSDGGFRPPTYTEWEPSFVAYEANVPKRPVVNGASSFIWVNPGARISNSNEISSWQILKRKYYRSNGSPVLVEIGLTATSSFIFAKVTIDGSTSEDMFSPIDFFSSKLVRLSLKDVSLEIRIAELNAVPDPSQEVLSRAQCLFEKAWLEVKVIGRK